MRPELFERSSRATQLNGRQVLIGLLLFFGIIFSVNGYFLFAALSTHTGVVANEPYRKGLAYNARIAADERQVELGWREIITATRGGELSLIVADRFGAPVLGLSVTAMIGRPSVAHQDLVVNLAEEFGGKYASRVGALDAGSWVVTIEARAEASAEPVFRSRRRLWLKP